MVRWIAILGLSSVGLALLTALESEMASFPLRYGVKLAWLALFAALAIRIAGVKLAELRPTVGRQGS